MPRVTPVTDDQAGPEAAKGIADMKALFGADWGLIRIMAHAPSVLQGFHGYYQAVQGGRFTPDEREAINLKMACLNGCHYCVPAHILGGRESGLSDDVMKAIIDGANIPDQRIALIVEATGRLDETKGALSDDELEDLRKRGLGDGDLIEIIGEMAHATLTNYMNRLARTDLDECLKDVKV